MVWVTLLFKTRSRTRAPAYLDDDAVVGGMGNLVAREHDVRVAVELPVDGRVGAKKRGRGEKKRCLRKIMRRTVPSWVGTKHQKRRPAGSRHIAREPAGGGKRQVHEALLYSHILMVFPSV